MSQPARDSGYTLIEVMVTLALLGVIMAIAVSGWSSWARASEQSGTARAIESAMRQAHQRAVTEGRAMCILFDDAADTYALYRGACDDAGKTLLRGPMDTQSEAVQIAAPGFTSGTGTPSTGVTFQARGTAWPGDVTVTRDSSSKVYTLEVEGLTGRVSLS
jgi:type II secretion system protein H